MVDNLWDEEMKELYKDILKEYIEGSQAHGEGRGAGDIWRGSRLRFLNSREDV
jgi:hypothetical protein